jgi:hypothetical protein
MEIRYLFIRVQISGFDRFPTQKTLGTSAILRLAQVRASTEAKVSRFPRDVRLLSELPGQIAQIPPQNQFAGPFPRFNPFSAVQEPATT